MIINCDTCRIKKTCKEHMKGFSCYYRFTTEQIETGKERIKQWNQYYQPK